MKLRFTGKSTKSVRTKELDYDYVMSFVILEIFGVKQFSYYVLDNNDQKEG